MSVISNNILAGASGQGSGSGPGPSPGYTISKSVRFNAGDSPIISRTPSSAGNRKTWTLSMWVKRAALGTKQFIFGTQGTTDATYTENYFHTDNTLHLRYGWNTIGEVRTTQVFRDVSAWMHIVIAFDVTQTTASDRLKLYVNGSQVTTFATDTRTNLSNSNYGVNDTRLHRIGFAPNGVGTDFLSAYLADVHFVDGQQLAASDFGELDTNNVWQAKQFSGSYGTNGYNLDFENQFDDAAGSNDWTGTGFTNSGTGIDFLIDSPTNYSASPNNGGNYATLNPLDGSPTGLSDGNLTASSANAYPTIIPGSGQWYYEVNGTGYTWDGTRANWTPRSGSHNFGQQPFSGTPTSGHVSLCTTNLPTPAVADGSDYFDTKLWTGNATNRTISGYGFSPDLVWIKVRSEAGRSHFVFDTIRGATQAIKSDNSDAQQQYISSLEAFNSDGFDLGTFPNVNSNTQTVVGWAWDAGSTTATNNTGSITSSVRANSTAGFSVVSYTGNATAGATVGHGLNAVPKFIVYKNLGGQDWRVYHSSVGATKALFLSTTAGETTHSSYFNDTAPTSTVFSLGTDIGLNQNSVSVIAYCWSDISDYSSFGSYTGSGSADGPFIYTGHRSKFLLIKASSIAGQDWVILDTESQTYNAIDSVLFSNSGGAESTNTAYSTDILSNGFKLRGTDSRFNQSGVTYVYASFASNPFHYSRAR